MSWQAYVDSSLVGSGHIDKGAIYSIKGDSVWATSPGFTISAAEMQEVVAGLSGKPDNLYSNGLHVAGQKYVLNKVDERSLYARKGKEGLVIVKTTQAILIGHYGENTHAGNSASVVEKLADYLISTGY